MKVLCTADVHIGRRPSRLPSHVDCRPLSCGEAWGRIVEVAIREGVELVAVAGDLVDRSNRFYEAAGPVQAGLRRLAEAGIVTVMVAGNHDHDVLRWQVEGLDGEMVRVLGTGGTWERFTLERNGETLHVDGWSFPQGEVHTSPLATYAPGGEGTVLGLLHADLDSPRSRYAPISRAELRSPGVSLWLLGHIHAPRLLEEAGCAPVLYPGSPQAMDPGEEGGHGVWIAELGGGAAPRCRLVPLSSVRYETVEVDVGGVTEAPEMGPRVVAAVTSRLEAAVQEAECLRYLSCRLRLVGRTRLHRTLAAQMRAMRDDLDLPFGDARAFVESWAVMTAPDRDLGSLAGGKDAPSVLAGLLAALESGDLEPEHQALLVDARARRAEMRGARPYLSLPPDIQVADGAADGDDAELRSELRAQATLLLDELLAQKEVGG